MRKIISYIAISLDGKIAKPDGNVDWLDELPNPDQLDYGYFAMYDMIDTTIMGNSTYRFVQSFDGDFPYPDKKNYVFTRNPALKDDEHVTYVNRDHIAFLKNLKEQAGKDIWIIGGGQVNTLALNHDLIDEMWVYVMPIVLGDGIPLFAPDTEVKQLRHTHTKAYPTGVVELRYERLT